MSSAEQHTCSRPVVLITGPTASGKSALAHALAKAINAEIVSADSRQIYRGMDIGTAKPSMEMLAEVPYHFINEKEIAEEYNAGDFTSDAMARIRSIHEKGHDAIVAGGSTLYIEGLLHGFSQLPKKDADIRRRLQEELNTGGAEKLYARLTTLDPEHARTLDPSKTQRLVRSLEIITITGKTVTGLRAAEHSRLSSVTFIPFGLSLQRNRLYERINTRTDAMMASGLLKEAEQLYERYLSAENRATINALETVGYKELFQYFDGIHSLLRAVELIQQHTRNYAKRQLTFFKNRLNVQWLAAPENLKELHEQKEQLITLYSKT
ncbi:MAG: tRNA (adenosine(37)-N6)-dimethylallyltransferase MiaA [Chlorobium phaeobacteroides]|uniref:tRNA dimethylallyltransferase n=1 Tax=Chlorobium phaeobacteroides (strain BS1) TaxID=331678 RepID=MIAA_CHLPB|nr:RecName: Full=tRNA dimethylallyltransferase; AltName: Full=Dimethylallyl diphosphate:tRNA dimethylallyltransferase; Short=DMAPP:tRNA dimethylallyltransferase; Short=DMATase; AltName: Full=Isopentenyl-diphosphate:tRNA isopentenyltransferase; Short=IPP transferase; Short=IPPT; Short=IPTase [Chlorobium phaeobacteroides BS1]MBC8524366.1 tRNA (adenosine(37)-N6)-dimethylallyltransferase MiaA [Chlorobium phaeobacteroides]MBL6956428.1 tRNA (adenosine(37)-N6)-dimethylallyltransferase MiaA [Chlorobium p